jgi:thymidine phosphorylase
VRTLEADRDGVVARVRALAVGVGALELGAGRRSKDDEIDHAVGLLLLKKRGDPVERGEPIAEVHAQDDASAEQAARRVHAAFELSDEAPEPSGVVLDVID